jgi:hypothetical protein
VYVYFRNPEIDQVFAYEVGTQDALILQAANRGWEKLDEWPPKPSPEHLLKSAKMIKAAEMATLCRKKILEGFKSNALGDMHHYPAKETDQANLSASVLDSILPGLSQDWVTPFWCQDSVGSWEFRLHTASQIQQVGREAKQNILFNMGTNDTLQKLIEAATTQEQVEAIVWPV